MINKMILCASVLVLFSSNASATDRLVERSRQLLEDAEIKVQNLNKTMSVLLQEKAQRAEIIELRSIDMLTHLLKSGQSSFKNDVLTIQSEGNIKKVGNLTILAKGVVFLSNGVIEIEHWTVNPIQVISLRFKDLNSLLEVCNNNTSWS